MNVRGVWNFIFSYSQSNDDEKLFSRKGLRYFSEFGCIWYGSWPDLCILSHANEKPKGGGGSLDPLSNFVIKKI